MSAEELIFEQMEALKAIKKFLENLRKAPYDRRTAAYYKGRLTLLESYFESFRSRHSKLISLCFKDELLSEHEYFEKDVFSDYEELFLGIQSDLVQKLEPVAASNTTSSDNLEKCVVDDQSYLRLPSIEIPKFYGNYQEWTSFRDLFHSLVHNNMKLSKVQKLHYLKSYLGGEASQLLKHIQITEASYDQAWSSLTQRYENKRSIVTSYLSTLFSLSPLPSESAIGIRKLIDTTIEVLHALTNLNVETRTWDPLIVFLTVQRLDPESRRLWEQSLGSKTDLPSFKELENFLNARHRALEAVTGTKAKTVPTSSKPKTHQAVRTFHISRDPPCPFCAGSHFLYKCEQFKQQPVDKRREVARSKSLCLNCLVPGHFATKCQQRARCHSCGKRHHTLLHMHTLVQPSTLTDSRNNTPPSRHVENTLATTTTQQVSTLLGTIHQRHRVMLATAIIRAESPSGSHLLRALLDQGSEGSLITENAAQLLQLINVPTQVTIRGIGSTTVEVVRKEVSLRISPRTSRSPSFQVTALVMPSLTGLVPSYEISSSVKTQFANLELADPSCFDPGRIDILLGADIYSQILLPEIKRQSPELPLAQRTVLGWILSGPCSSNINESERKFHHVSTYRYSASEVETQLRKFWELENIQDQPSMTPEEDSCESLFKSTITRSPHGRYVVRLPFKSVLQDSSPPVFHDTREGAVKRLLYLEKRFAKCENLKREYSRFMQEYLELGHMSPVEPNSPGVHEYYLPHHPVIKESSTTTKLRVVFDGSSKSKCGRSLNETLSTGPALQMELSDIILRWRQHKIVLAADIEKMYRQVLVSDGDTHYQRIVWRFNENEPIQDFRLLTVTYGTSCAPYLAIRTLKQLALDYKATHAAASQIVLKNFYVDDVMFGTHDEENALELQSQLSSLLKLGGFHLRKWSSNRNCLLENIPEADREINVSLQIGDANSVKTLGIHWFPSTDEFGYIINLSEHKGHVSKRSLLSDIARLFDPLGWLSPSIIVAKIMLQQLWLSGVTWDDPLPPELEREWILLRNELRLLEGIRIPRWIHWDPSQENVELHGFADASLKAYAATVYVRIENHDHEVRTTLLAAKTRVSPIKQVSLPRLELCAATLLTRLLSQVQRGLDMQIHSVSAWSDSTIVLCWLRSHPSRWQTFVANRVSEIQSNLNSTQWHYVASHDNPADCASRGIPASQLITNDLWWHGPTWLSQSKDVWSSSPLLSNLETDMEARRIKPLISTITFDDFDLLRRFSSLSRMTRTTAYCLRFGMHCRKLRPRSQSKDLQAEEINKALRILCKISQAEDFPDELHRLQRNMNISKRSKLLNLNPFLDDEGILRVGGRLQLSSLPEFTKHPIILSNQSPLSKLLIREAHIVTFHGGISLILSHLRRRYWILHAKGLVKTEVHRCSTCVRHRATSRTQIMGQLPKDRVSISRPFSHSGVDYAGPVSLKISRGRGTLTYKGYICLFICLATKAIHLELVSDYTSEAFIAAFRRFTSRRGKCSHIYSDCGTTFVGANKELGRSHKQTLAELPTDIAAMLTSDHTTWHFIPPASPNFGGLWEAGVKSTKYHLRRIIGETPLTFEEFSTLLSQIEAVLNSRPLCPLSNEPDDFNVLTPGHFLIGEPLISVPESSLLEVNLNRLTRWQLVQRMHQHFWNRWSSEYVTRLQQRPKWLTRSMNLIQGDIVIIKDGRLPPSKWLLGRIVATHAGKDGLVRVATLKTKNGIFQRPVTKLCVLPVTDLEDKERTLPTTRN